MPTKKSGKKATKTIKQKQSVKQTVVVNVGSHSKRRPANERSFSKGMSYMGAAMRPFYPSPNNIVVNTPQPQPAFSSDVVNRISALENLQKNQMTNMQQSRNVVQPVATMPQSYATTIGLQTDDLTPLKTSSSIQTDVPKMSFETQTDVPKMSFETQTDSPKATFETQTDLPKSSFETQTSDDDFTPTLSTPKPPTPFDKKFDEVRSSDINDLKSIMQMSGNPVYEEEQEAETSKGQTPVKEIASKFESMSPISEYNATERRQELLKMSMVAIKGKYNAALKAFKDVNNGKDPQGPKITDRTDPRGYVNRIITIEKRIGTDY
jgi:hypothetical protein